ncbi:MAG: response regulator [Cyanobacteria bacterium SBLK]|nr:response regulator [Cyanobacteria bacterium SBLK]
MKTPPIYLSQFQLPLRVVFIIPFLLEIGFTVGIVGYLSFKNGQKVVENLAHELIEETGDRIESNLYSFLAVPPKIALNHQHLIDTELLDLKNMDFWIPYLDKQYHNHRSDFVTVIQISNQQDEYRAPGEIYLKNKLTSGIAISGEKTDFQMQVYYNLKHLKSLSNPFLTIDEFQATQRPWYQQAVARERAIWTDIYLRVPALTLTLAFAHPLYVSREKEPQGVSSVLLDLSYINKFLQSLKIGKTGQALIIEPSGDLIATSIDENPIVLKAEQRLRLKAKESRDPVTQAIANNLEQYSEELFDIENLQVHQFKVENQKYFFQTIALKDKYGLDWTIAIAIPESDFIAEIHANTRQTILLSLLALGIAVIIGLLTSRWVIQPILQLNHAAKKIADGDWNSRVKITRNDELGQLGSSFNRMAAQVQQSFQELSHSQHQLSQFLESLPVGVTVHNLDSSISYLNQTAKILLDREEIDPYESISSDRIYHSQTRAPYPTEKLPIFQAIQGNKTIANDLEIHWGNRIIPLEVSATPIYNEEGKVIQAIAVFQDITDRKKAEKILKEYSESLELQVKQRTLELEKAKEKAEVANQAKSIFLANMSHELRSPLNAVLGFSQLMMRSQALSQEQQENMSIINRSGEYLLTLINNVLDLSKIEAGKIVLNPQNFDLYRLLNEVEDLFSLRAENKQLQLIFERDRKVPQYIKTDATKLRQVLINLINNALKFTSDGGIFVRIESTELLIPHDPLSITQIHFAVEDTGAGIADNELDRLFEAFRQTQTGKDAQEGTGLGLPISRKFVQLMGGDIVVKSKVGKGTTFLFDIRVQCVRASEVKNNQVKNRVIALEANQPRYKILIVDDKEVNRRLLIKLLQPLGFDLQEAANGRKAVEIWENWQPHLIWMDMRMPVMDGYEAVQYIKGTTRGQATAVIALTASVLEEEKAVTLSAGCDDFIRKPFREDVIFEAMGKHLGVRYIYEKNAVLEEDKKPYSLASESLQAMTAEWLIRVHQAALDLDDELLLTAIAEIPKTHRALAATLTDFVNRFHYDAIAMAIEPLLTDLHS